MKAFRTIEQFVNQHPTISAFTVVLAIMLYSNLSHTQFKFYWDSAGYWSSKDKFVSNGTFSLLNYNYPLRGYLFPLLLFLISRAVQLVGVPDTIGLEICLSLGYTAFLTVWAPALVQTLYGKRPGFYVTLLFGLLALLFWRGLFFYPLSDLPSFILVVSGTLLVLKFPKRPVPALWTGLLWGGAVVVRPTYLAALPFLLLWAVYYYFTQTESSRLRGLASSVAILAGLVLVNIPQAMINYTQFQVLTPFVQTERVYPNGLINWQLAKGIVIQKFETNVGDTYPAAAVSFPDLAGQKILARAGYDLRSYNYHMPTLTQYVRLVWYYPLDFLTLYARHAFNGLDVVYNTVYVPDIYDTNILLRLLNYSVWFLVLAYLAHAVAGPPASPLSASQWLVPMIFALPAVASIPTAMEVRFMVPVQLMAYALVSFWVLPGFAHKDLNSKKNTILRHLVWYGLFIMLCLTLSATTYGSLKYGAYVLR